MHIENALNLDDNQEKLMIQFAKKMKPSSATISFIRGLKNQWLNRLEKKIDNRYETKKILRELNDIIHEIKFDQNIINLSDMSNDYRAEQYNIFEEEQRKLDLSKGWE